MSEPKWLAQLPAEPAGAFPECVDDEIDLHDARYVGASLSSATVAERPEIVNVVLDGCDIAGFIGSEGRADRALLKDCRLRGTAWVNGLVRDVHFDSCVAAETSFRFTEFRHVVFKDCKLPAIDFTNATFDDVRFENCELTRATFDHVRTLPGVRIEHCELTDCSGVDALRGASVHPDDVTSLAQSMARAIGLIVE